MFGVFGGWDGGGGGGGVKKAIMIISKGSNFVGWYERFMCKTSTVITAFNKLIKMHQISFKRLQHNLKYLLKHLMSELN